MSNVLNKLCGPLATDELLWELCEFRSLDQGPPNWFALKSGKPLQVVGGDATGGRFCTLTASGKSAGRLLHIDSEGSAGVIAASLAEGIRMMIALPYWRDCLKFSGGGELAEMRRAQARLEVELRRRRPGIDTERDALYASFDLSAPTAPLDALHKTVAGSAKTRVIARSDDSPMGSLFNTFVVKD